MFAIREVERWFGSMPVPRDHTVISQPDEARPEEEQGPQEEPPMRAKYEAAEIVLLDVAAGNLDQEEGEPITIMTLAETVGGNIFPVALTNYDAQRLAVKLLASLRTAKDSFAAKVLEDHFPHDHKGQFCWPKGKSFGSE